MRRLTPLLAALMLLAGCGSGGETTTVTKPAPVPPPSENTTPDAGATEPAPAARERSRGERIDIGDLLFFHTPSKRIGCAVASDPKPNLRCDTAFPTRFSRTGHRCEFGDYGQAFQLRRSGAAEAICAGDTVLSSPGARTIPYGKTWLLGPFSCTSRKSGLSCRNGDGHGLALSVQAQKVS